MMKQSRFSLPTIKAYAAKPAFFHRKLAGFSLIELLISLSIVSFLVGIAIPNYYDFVAQRRVDSTQSLLIQSLALARNEAVTRGESVIICALVPNQNKCAVAVNTPSDWSAGWQIVVGNITTGAVIRHNEQLVDNININFTNGNQIIFGALGELNSSINAEQNFVVDDSKSGIIAGLSLRTTGRLRVCLKWDKSANQCADS